MKRIITLLLFSLSTYWSFSQDVITYKNGKTQKVVVLSTNDKDITCQDFESKEQFTISRSFITSVVYQEGKVEPLGVVLVKPMKAEPLIKNGIVQTADTVHYQSGGAILYKGVSYVKPDDISSILLKQPNPEIASYLNSYKSNRGTANVLAFIGGGLMGWPIGGAIRGQKFDTGLFLGGIGVATIGLGVFGVAAIKSLKNATSSYNKAIIDKKVTFNPIFYQDRNQQTNVGLVVGF